MAERHPRYRGAFAPFGQYTVKWLMVDMNQQKYLRYECRGELGIMFISDIAACVRLNLWSELRERNSSSLTSSKIALASLINRFIGKLSWTRSKSCICLKEAVQN